MDQLLPCSCHDLSAQHIKTLWWDREPEPCVSDNKPMFLEIQGPLDASLKKLFQVEAQNL